MRCRLTGRGKSRLGPVLRLWLWASFPDEQARGLYQGVIVADPDRIAAALRYQQDLDAAQRPATMNPNLAAQGEAYRANMTPPTSVMDPRYPAWKKNQDAADAVGAVGDLALSAIPMAGPAMQGVKAAGRFAGPELASGLENYMGRMGMRLNAVPSSPMTEGEMRHLLAQQRAALPVEQHGLGLPAGNTPQQRADAMGFDSDVYHGSANVANTTRFDPNKVVDNVQYGGKFYSSTSPDYANKYTTNSLRGDSAGVIPMKMRSGKKFEMDKPVSADDAASIMETLGQFDRAKMIRESGRPYRNGSELFYFGLDSSLSNVPKGNAIFRSGFDSIHGDPSLEITGIAGKPHSVVDSADNLRSRFAAFDPFRRNAAIAALMGVAAPDLLAQENK